MDGLTDRILNWGGWLIAAALGIIGKLFSDKLEMHKQEMRALTLRHDNLEKEFLMYQLQANKDYVTKIDLQSAVISIKETTQDQLKIVNSSVQELKEAVNKILDKSHS